MYIQANHYTPCQTGFLRIQVLTEGHMLCSSTMTVVKLEQDQKREREREKPPKNLFTLKTQSAAVSPFRPESRL